jgi:DNA ligase 1
MPDLLDGQSVEIRDSASRPYILKNVGGVYSCSCPAWRNQSLGIERRSCKHIRQLRGDAAEEARIGSALPQPKNERKNNVQAPSLLLAEIWNRANDPTGWWLSEKLDGIRCYYDGARFLSRQGNRLHPPEWFSEGLPKVPLDGELWLGRKKFQRTVSIVRRQDQSDLWKEVCYVVFDAPAQGGLFEERQAFLKECLDAKCPPYAHVLGHDLCHGVEHLYEELRRVESLGGEGLMVRRPQSRYENGRSQTLLKLKTMLDAEALVIAHQEGTGRHKNRLGALLVEMEDGTRFAVGTGFSDAEREQPPAIGSLITFRYQELSDRGVPRFPTYVGVRADSAQPLPTSKGDEDMSATTVNHTRRFEFKEGSSSKFWECTSDGTEVMVRFGRIGSQGQATRKAFASEQTAGQHVAKVVGEKLAKGYVEVAAA